MLCIQNKTKDFPIIICCLQCYCHEINEALHILGQNYQIILNDRQLGPKFFIFGYRFWDFFTSMPDDGVLLKKSSKLLIYINKFIKKNKYSNIINGIWTRTIWLANQVLKMLILNSIYLIQSPLIRIMNNVIIWVFLSLLYKTSQTYNNLEKILFTVIKFQVILSNTTKIISILLHWSSF